MSYGAVKHFIGSEMLGVKSADYILHTHGLFSLNTPGNLLHTLGAPKTGQEEKTLTCVEITSNIFSVYKCRVRLVR